MTTTELEARYRNLLVTLARDAQQIQEEVQDIRASIEKENGLGRRLGLRTALNQRHRQHARLVQLLMRNKAALRYFFASTNPEVVAAQKIILH